MTRGILGFDHIAIAAGAGRPTIIDMKNNLAAAFARRRIS